MKVPKITQNLPPSQEDHEDGFFLWLKLKAMLAWLKRTVMAMMIAGSLYVGAAPASVSAANYDVGDYAALLAAINDANASAEDDTITLTGDITLGGNLPLIRSNIVFEGNAHYVDGAGAYRVFSVGRFDSAPTVAFRDMTIQNGLAQGGNGGGGGGGLGGGMFVYDGVVTLDHITFADNAALGGARTGNLGGGGMGGSGGGNFGGGGGLWAGANGGSLSDDGGSAGHYGGGGGGNSDSGGDGGGLNGGAGGNLGGGGGGLNGGAGGGFVGGAGGWGGGGGGGWYGGWGGFGGGGGGGQMNGGFGGFGGGGGFGYYGGGGGLGGGLFIRTGVLTMTTVAFNANTATGGAANGQGKGGGLFVLHSTANSNGNDQGMPATLPVIDAGSCGVTFAGNTAANDAGALTDNDDAFGDLSDATDVCELTLIKSVAPATHVAYHGLVTYTLALVSPVSDTVVLTDVLPPDVTFASWVVSPTGASRVDNTITWTGAVTVGEMLTWTFSAAHTGNYADVITNTATFSGTTRAGSAQATFDVEWGNYPPELTLIGDRAVVEGASLTFTATATDDGKPSGVLTYALDAGSAGEITAGGVYTWTPTDADSPGVHTATVRVSDGELDDSETFSITVSEVNQGAPALGPLGDYDVDEGATVAFTATASDVDVPLVVTYTLDSGAPAGASIAPATGAFTWPPSEAQGPGVYSMTVRVSDGALDDVGTFTITVNETNQPPALQPIGHRAVAPSRQLRFVARTVEPDLPTQALTYALDAGSVGSIGAQSGLFTWTAGAAQGVYTATVRVSDGQVEDFETFNIFVGIDTVGIGQGVIAVNSVYDHNANTADFNVVDAVDNAVYGPFPNARFGSLYGQHLDVAVTPDGNTALISHYVDAAVFLVDVTNPLTPALITSVPLPFLAGDIAISADGQYALVAGDTGGSRLASIHIPSAMLVQVADLGAGKYVNGVAIASDGTVVLSDYDGGGIHTALLAATGEIAYAHTYTYTYPGIPLTDTMHVPHPVNTGIAPDGQTVIVCDAYTSTVGIYQIVAPGVLTFTGVVTGLHGAYGGFYTFPWNSEHDYPQAQSVAFNVAGDRAYVSINEMRMDDVAGANTGDRLGVLRITAPGQVSLEAGGVVTVPHATSFRLLGVDTLAIAGNKAFVGYPSNGFEGDNTALAVVALSDYSVTTTMALTRAVSIPAGVASVPLRRLFLRQTVSDPAPYPGQLITYVLTLDSTGLPISRQNGGITLRDALPPGVEFAGAIALFPPDAGVVGSSPAELATDLAISPGQRITVTFQARVNAAPPGTVVTNTVRAESAQLDVPAVAYSFFTIAPHLALDKALDDATPRVEQVIVYTLTLANVGPLDDPAVALTDTLPAQAVFGGWVGENHEAVVDNNAITWDGPLAASEALTLVFTVTHTADGGETVVNTVESSGMGQSDSASAAFTVRPDAAPAADDDAFTVVENRRNNLLDVLAGDTDADGDSLSVIALGTPDQGGVALNAGTAIAYTPALDFTGDEVFTYTVGDGYGGFTTARVTVTVTPLLTYTLSVAAIGNGAVTLDPDLPVYKAGTQVTLTATADSGWYFGGWTGDLNTASAVETLTLDGNKAVTATFTQAPPVTHTLTIVAAGDGSGVVTPTVGAHTYISGTLVALGATPNAGSSFSGWSGDAGCASVQVTLDADKVCTATFTLEELHYFVYLPLVARDLP